jgi:hypothetical protein
MGASIGKTTTIRILATLLRPEGGTARVLGHDVVREAAAVRKLVSLTGQFASVDADLTAEKNLLLLAPVRGPADGHRRFARCGRRAVRPRTAEARGPYRRLTAALPLHVQPAVNPGLCVLPVAGYATVQAGWSHAESRVSHGLGRGGGTGHVDAGHVLPPATMLHQTTMFVPSSIP